MSCFEIVFFLLKSRVLDLGGLLFDSFDKWFFIFFLFWICVFLGNLIKFCEEFVKVRSYEIGI